MLIKQLHQKSTKSKWIRESLNSLESPVWGKNTQKREL